MSAVESPLRLDRASARRPDEFQPRPPIPRHWLLVMCLIGVDYFSSLAYQPSITFEAAGYLGPVATLGVVLLTLLAAVPIYSHVAGRSPHGQGSIALLEKLVHGWRGKTLIVLLLGFAATDFVMTKTLSLADAAEHVLHNPWMPWQEGLHSLAEWKNAWLVQWFGEDYAGFVDKQLVVTILLGVICFGWWAFMRKGFTDKAVVVGVLAVVGYMVMSAVIIGSGLAYLWQHPELVDRWWERLQAGQWHPAKPALAAPGPLALLLLCFLLLPQLVLGLSGFELSLVAMPGIKGNAADEADQLRLRIRNTRKALFVAALVMAVFLLGSALVTSLLIPPEAFAEGGAARHRALAYLAHDGALADGVIGVLNPLFGDVFGSLYDLATVVLLCLAGMSVMAALQTLVPQFLLRFGMELKWAHAWGVLLILFALVNLLVTVHFKASVEAQRGAYSMGVLVLISSAGVLTAMDCRRDRSWVWLYFAPMALGLVALTLTLLVGNPSGLPIAAGFILVLFITSVVSRAMRVGELRTVGFEFADEASKERWEKLQHLYFPVLVPHRPGRRARDDKASCIRGEHQLDPDAQIVFMEVEIQDASDFFQNLLIEVFEEDSRQVIRIRRCVSVSHAIAAVAVEMSRYTKPPALHFGWPEMTLVEASYSYLVFGEGNIPWRVRELIQREQPDPEHRPRVIVG